MRQRRRWPYSGSSDYYKGSEKLIRIIVTAGPTEEPIDPVRFISNRSTGHMGYRIAEEALKRKHKVTLISGPVDIIPPRACNFISIRTADELLRELKKIISKADCLFMCAAVSDFKVSEIATKKIKRDKSVNIKLIPNKDMLKELGGYHKRNLFIGFSLETENLVRNSYIKLKSKKLDLIVANSFTRSHNPFGNNKLDVTLIDKNRRISKIRDKNKAFIAHVLLDKIEEMWYLKNK
ncbi:MAG: phosphopantothenoylcysteine decarboxylase [Candidatus Omnitrophota bacterium]|nr:phosphopantothenoylcysteine decarboxylase [Candidatus Omnitrophota bacterium]